jgi:hypothetical protein
VATAVGHGTVDFHGVPIMLSYEPFEGDAFNALFAGFQRRAAAPDGLQVELRTTPRATEAGVSLDWRATFCHGLVQGYSRDGAHVLSDGESRISVSPSLGRMQGEIFQHARTDLAGGMQHIGLSLLLRERGIFDLHAATACTKSRALALIGDSGAGKTTLLLSLMGVGCDFLGDDRLLFRAVRGGTELLAYPREFHLSPSTLKLVDRPIADSNLEAAVGGKYSIEPLKVWPERFRQSWRGPIGLILPHIGKENETRVRRATAAEAFGKLLSSSAAVVVEAIGNRPEQLHALQALANVAEAYDVVLGSDLLSRPAETARRILLEIDSLARKS